MKLFPPNKGPCQLPTLNHQSWQQSMTRPRHPQSLCPASKHKIQSKRLTKKQGAKNGENKFGQRKKAAFISTQGSEMLRHEVRMSHGWSNLKPKKQMFSETRVNKPKSKVPPFRSLPRSKYSSSLCVCTSWEASQFHWTATTVDENLRKLDTTGRILCICTFFNEPPFRCFEEKNLVIFEKNWLKSGWKNFSYHFGTSLKSGAFLLSSIMPTSTLKGDACTPLGFHTAPLVYKLAFAAPSKDEQQYLSKSSRWWSPLKNHSSLAVLDNIWDIVHEMIWTVV